MCVCVKDRERESKGNIESSQTWEDTVETKKLDSIMFVRLCHIDVHACQHAHDESESTNLPGRLLTKG